MLLPHQEFVNKQTTKYCGVKVHQYFWFMLSGFMCDLFQAVVDYFISTIYVWEFERTTVCWTLSYCASICVRHMSHKIIVFGDYDGTYCQSLSRVYLAYLSSIIISTVANHVLSNYVGLSHRACWLSTMIWIGVYNYFALKNVWSKNKLAVAAAAANPGDVGSPAAASSGSGSGSGSGSALSGIVDKIISVLVGSSAGKGGGPRLSGSSSSDALKAGLNEVEMELLLPPGAGAAGAGLGSGHGKGMASGTGMLLHDADDDDLHNNNEDHIV